MTTGNCNSCKDFDDEHGICAIDGHVVRNEFAETCRKHKEYEAYIMADLLGLLR